MPAGSETSCVSVARGPLGSDEPKGPFCFDAGGAGEALPDRPSYRGLGTMRCTVRPGCAQPESPALVV